MIRVYLLSVVILFACACHKEQDNTNRNFTTADRDFMFAASYANRAQVAIGSWAVTKGSTESIRTYGQTMALTYQQSQNELYSLADSLRSSLPRQPDEGHLAYATELSSLSGHAFDSTYIENQLTDLSAMVELFQQKSNAEGDQQLKDYANKYLPEIKKHLEAALLIKENF